MHRKVVGALAMVLALALASCGGSGSDTVTKASFAKQANAACAKARKDSEKVRGKGITAFADRVENYAKSKAKGVEGLDPPDKLKTTYAQYTGVLTQRSELISRLVVEVKARRRISKQDEKTIADLQNREERLATTLGLRACRENQAPAERS